MEHLNALPAGTRLREYEIEGVLGAGGFGITYRARDTHLNTVWAIKEYLPSVFATRTNAHTVVPISQDDRADYERGLERFRDEGATLALFKNNPHINTVSRYFEAHGTAYLVLEYLEGRTLHEELVARGRLGEAAVGRLLRDVLSGLAEVHGADYVHRDLKPGNLMMQPDGRVVILDFGSARQDLTQRSQNPESVQHTPGYAPPEQEARQVERIGPWSDLYALGMIAYQCVSGVRGSDLPNAVSRQMAQDRGEVSPAAVEVGQGRYDRRLLEAIDWAIQIREEDRPQSIAEWRTALPDAVSAGVPAPPPPPPSRVAAPPPARSEAPPQYDPPTPLPQPARQPPARSARWTLVVGVVALMVAVAGGAYWYARQQGAVTGGPQEVVSGPAVTEPDRAERTSPSQPIEPALEGETEIEREELAEAERRVEVEAGRQVGETFRDCASCPQMVVVPAGSFLMGVPEAGRDDHGGPVHRVTIAQPFAVGVYEVTREEYGQFVGAAEPAVGSTCGPVSYSVLDRDENELEWNWREPGFKQTEADPVVCISWADAQAYIAWLSQETGQRYRLLSEAEWEYVARAKTRTRYHFGNRIVASRANYGMDWMVTLPVGRFEPNEFGLYDVHGNVAEWVQDCWNGVYVGAPSDGSAWEEGNCSQRIVRGGSWGSGPEYLRSDHRDYFDPVERVHSIGFRIARRLTP